MKPVALLLGLIIMPAAAHTAELKVLAGGSLTASLKELAGLKNLTELALENTKVTNAGVKELQKALPKCKIFK